MQHKKGGKKKKKRSRAGEGSGKGAARRDDEKKEENGCQRRVEKEDENLKRFAIKSLPVVFGSFSMEDATAAFVEANGDPNRAAEIFSCSKDGSEFPSTSSISSAETSSSTGSGSSKSFEEACCGAQNIKKEKGFRRGRQKRVVAAAGTVSTMLGKDYVRSVPRKEISASKGLASMEEAEQFLCSMLGDECELDLGVVRDVFCQCGYNFDEALNLLRDMSGSSCGQLVSGRTYKDNISYMEDVGSSGFSIEKNDNLADGASDCTFSSFESEENYWAPSYRKYLTGSEAPCRTSSGSKDSDLPQKVLESLFNVSRSSEHEPYDMNWRNVVKKMQSLGSGFDACYPTVAEPHPASFVKGEEYHLFRKAANQHWDAKKSYYQKAAEAYSKGERAYAAYLSDQGRTEAKLARQDDERATQAIFKARNEDIENVITIDLHGQHVKPAMRILKVHLVFGSYVQSVRVLRVITGCGSHGVGKSKLKQSVKDLLDSEGIEWREENRGTLLVKLDGYKDFHFLDSDSDVE